MQIRLFFLFHFTGNLIFGIFYTIIFDLLTYKKNAPKKITVY